MALFEIHSTQLDTSALVAAMDHPTNGAVVEFEGRVRNHHQGQSVLRLEYEACEPLAIADGCRILEQLLTEHDITAIHCIHRVGVLEIGETAIWIGVTSAHRGAAFDACRDAIDRIKDTVPVWKKEYYTDHEPIWVNCAEE